ncbi:MAG: hypothetical protein LIP23_00025 [Planctomycetes bacterium]|nr:hypothetical protein [Planctomycetota bacterium]
MAKWPEWKQPDEKAVLEMTKAVTPFVRFLHQDVVKQLVDDNQAKMELFRSALRRAGIQPELYLWDGCSCAFPGIRRYSGNMEIAVFRKKSSPLDEMKDAVALDDNSYPKHIWSFVCRGVRCGKFGPKGYALAHLADHKVYNSSRYNDDFHCEFPDGFSLGSTAFFGLYTAATNTVYMPQNVIDLSDYSPRTRALLMNKAVELYGESGQLFPPCLKLREIQSPEWRLDAFAFAEPVGAGVDLTPFLTYRQQVLTRLLSL